MATVLKKTIEKSYLTDDERWVAVVQRDRNANDAFVYCVKPRVSTAVHRVRPGLQAARTWRFI
jgi:hypothetical protein